MRKRKLGDRYDGYRVKNCDPTNVIIPFLLKERDDSQVFFDTEVDLTKVEAIIKKKRNEGIKIGVIDYIFAATIRTISQYPRVNRFVAGRRLFARNTICVSTIIKKEFNLSSYRTLVKSDFSPNATLKEVNDSLQNIIIKNKGKDTENDLDKFLKTINRLPRPLYSLAINVLSWLDFHGKLPKYIYKICPFHSSVIITHMGSIGSEPMYHHICNWGTTSLFIAVGAKRKIKQIDNDGNIIEKKIVRLRFVADERIADGYYLSKSLKYFNYLFSNPELLEIPPEKVLEDDQI